MLDLSDARKHYWGILPYSRGRNASACWAISRQSAIGHKFRKGTTESWQRCLSSKYSQSRLKNDGMPDSTRHTPISLRLIAGFEDWRIDRPLKPVG
jgi:hypothetical protein